MNIKKVSLVIIKNLYKDTDDLSIKFSNCTDKELMTSAYKHYDINEYMLDNINPNKNILVPISNNEFNKKVYDPITGYYIQFNDISTRNLSFLLDKNIMNFVSKKLRLFSIYTNDIFSSKNTTKIFFCDIMDLPHIKKLITCDKSEIINYFSHLKDIDSFTFSATNISKSCNKKVINLEDYKISIKHNYYTFSTKNLFPNKKRLINKKIKKLKMQMSSAFSQ